MTRPGYSQRSTRTQIAAREDRLAELVAEGASLRSAAATMGIPPTTANSIFAAIRRKLGWQAA